MLYGGHFLDGGSSVSSEFLILESVHNESPSPFLFTYLKQPCDLSVCSCLLKGNT